MHSTSDNSASSQPASRNPATHNAPIQFAGSRLGNGLSCLRLFWHAGGGVSRVVAVHQGRVICTCDLSKHSAPFIIDIMRTHPIIIIGGILQENPFYVQPEEFVRKLRAREASSQGPAGASA